MNTKNIKLMLLGIALMTLGFGWIFILGFNLLDFLWLLSNEGYDYDVETWLDAVFSSVWVIIQFAAVCAPIAGLVLVIVGFCKKDVEVEIQEIIEKEEDNEQER